MGNRGCHDSFLFLVRNSLVQWWYHVAAIKYLHVSIFLYIHSYKSIAMCSTTSPNLTYVSILVSESTMWAMPRGTTSHYRLPFSFQGHPKSYRMLLQQGWLIDSSLHFFHCSFLYFFKFFIIFKIFTYQFFNNF